MAATASMSLSLDNSISAEYLRFIGRFCGVSTASASTGPIRLRLNKTCLYEINTINRYFTRFADREDELLGESALEKSMVKQWVSKLTPFLSLDNNQSNNGTSLMEINNWLEKLDRQLLSMTYLVGNRPTLADAMLFWAVYFHSFQFFKNGKDPKSKKPRYNLERWYDLMQHTVGIMGFPKISMVDLPKKHVLLSA